MADKQQNKEMETILLLEEGNKLMLKFQTRKSENKYLTKFIPTYISRVTEYKNLGQISIISPDENHSNSIEKSPDYILEELNIAVEVKRIVDGEYRKRMNRANKHRKKLQERINSIMDVDTRLRGRYYLGYPSLTGMKKRKLDKMAKKIVEEVSKGKNEFYVEGLGEFHVVHKKSSESGRIDLSITSTGIFSKDIPKDISERLKMLIKNANIQLGMVEVRRRILLLVDEYPWADDIMDFVKSLNFLGDDLFSCESIDEIWLLFEDSNSNGCCNLLYKKEFIHSFLNGGLIFNDPENLLLYERLFYPPLSWSDDKKELLFTYLKILVQDKRIDEMFCEASRLGMVELCEWLLRKGKEHDTIWLIDGLVQDKSQAVLINLCWVVRGLALKQETFPEAFRYTTLLLENNSPEVKAAAIIPLVEICSRRRWFKYWGRKPRTGSCEQFHQIMFDLLRYVKEHAESGDLIDRVAGLFVIYREDLSTEEAKEVLEVFKQSSKYAKLLVVFSLFNEHVTGFDSSFFMDEMYRVLESRKKEDQLVRCRIARYFYRILRKNGDNLFNKISPCISKMLNGKYDRDVIEMIGAIIEYWLDRRPNVCISWYKRMLQKANKELLREIKGKHDERLDIWFPIPVNRIVRYVAAYRKEELAEIASNIMQLWGNGVFLIGIDEVVDILAPYVKIR